MKKKLLLVQLNKSIFSIKYAFFVLMILFTSATYAVDVTVSSITELKSHLGDSNMNLTMAPGEYRVNSTVGYTSVTYGAQERRVLFYFQGSDNTFDFTGVTFIVETAVFRAFGNFDVYEFNIVGNNNILKNLTLVDEGDSYPKGSAINIVVDGRDNRLEGFNVTARGSFPYGYGDAFGKGAGPVIKHYKHSACLIRGKNNYLKNSNFIHRSYGHCIFFQAAESPLVEGCTVEGEMRSTDDMLAEAGTGSPADLVGFMTDWGYKLPGGFMMSLGEAGIRAYDGGNTVIDGVTYSRACSDPVVRNCTVKYMRTAYGLHQATGTETIENCTAIGCETSFDGGIVKNCTADVSYGPAFSVSEDNLNMEVKIIQSHPTILNGQNIVAYISGAGSTFKITGDGGTIDPSLKLQIGGGAKNIRLQPGSNLEYQNVYTASNNYVKNATATDLILDAQSSTTSGLSCGAIYDNGVNNTILASNCDFTNGGLLVGETFTTGGITYQVITVNPKEVSVIASTLAALVIPATVIDPQTLVTCSVTTIKAGVFYNNKVITSIVTPSTLKEIGTSTGNDGTFRGTTSLVSADFSASSLLTALPNILFRGSAIQSVILPSSLTTYGTNCFRDCLSLKSVEVRNATPAIIGTDIFTNLTLSGISLTVPATTKTTYQGAAVWKSFGTITEATALSTKEIEQELGFSFYPNPTTDIVSIKSKPLNNAKVSVYDLNGRVLLNKNISGTSSEINISDLASGIYLFKVQVEDASFTKRIVKQ